MSSAAAFNLCLLAAATLLAVVRGARWAAGARRAHRRAYPAPPALRVQCCTCGGWGCTCADERHLEKQWMQAAYTGPAPDNAHLSKPAERKP